MIQCPALHHCVSYCSHCSWSVLSGSVQAQSVAPEGENAYATWFELTPDGDARIHLYFFWSKTCPHCQEAHPFITALPEQFPWLDLHDYELSESQENGQRYAEMAAMTGSEAMYVPAFFFCGNMTSGYGSHETTGATLVEGLEGCHEFVLKNFAGRARRLSATGRPCCRRARTGRTRRRRAKTSGCGRGRRGCSAGAARG